MTSEIGPAEDRKHIAANDQNGPAAPRQESASTRYEHHHPNSTSNGKASDAEKRHWLEYAAAIFAFVAALGSISAVTVGYWQWNSMNGQLAVMQIDQRPWIGAPIIASRFIKPTRIYEFTLNFKNTGKTPTAGFYIGARTVSATLWESEAERQCQTGKSGAGNRADFNKFAVVPGGEFSMGDNPQAIFTNFNKTDIDTKKLINPHIAGCVIYGSRFDDVLHQTKFVGVVKVNDASVSVDPVYPVEPN